MWLSLIYVTGPYVELILELATGEIRSEAYLVALILNTILMITLWRFPEWYIVNLVGVLVGSAVITMIGISFVPVLIIIFMILAAIYDHWAVNGSKHMLELADTMIDLKLPILLVAPKDKNYTFLEEKGNMKVEPRKIPNPEDWDNPKIDTVELPKGGRDALFMGLGDVIFPGMLVISVLTFLPTSGYEINSFFGTVYLDSLLVALGTLVGGLTGYFGLMTQVAKGKPQAGLPLLNGGAILGYFITVLIVFGPSELIQEITL